MPLYYYKNVFSCVNINWPRLGFSKILQKTFLVCGLIDYFKCCCLRLQTGPLPLRTTKITWNKDYFSVCMGMFQLGRWAFSLWRARRSWERVRWRAIRWRHLLKVGFRLLPNSLFDSLRLTELLSRSLGTRHAYVRHLYNYSSNFQIWFFICLNQNGAAPASDQEFIASVRDSRILKKWINYYIVDNRYRRVDTGIIPGVQASKSVH